MERFSIRVVSWIKGSISKTMELKQLNIPGLDSVETCRNFILGRFTFVAKTEEDYNSIVELLGPDNLEVVDPIQWQEWEASKNKHCEVSLTDEQLEASEWYEKLSLKEKVYIETMNSIWCYGPSPTA